MEAQWRPLMRCLMVFIAMAMGSTVKVIDSLRSRISVCGEVGRFCRGLLGKILRLVCTVIWILVGIGLQRTHRTQLDPGLFNGIACSSLQLYCNEKVFRFASLCTLCFSLVYWILTTRFALCIHCKLCARQKFPFLKEIIPLKIGWFIFIFIYFFLKYLEITFFLL